MKKIDSIDTRMLAAEIGRRLIRDGHKIGYVDVVIGFPGREIIGSFGTPGDYHGEIIGLDGKEVDEDDGSGDNLPGREHQDPRSVETSGAVSSYPLPYLGES